MKRINKQEIEVEREEGKGEQQYVIRLKIANKNKTPCTARVQLKYKRNTISLFPQFPADACGHIP